MKTLWTSILMLVTALPSLAQTVFPVSTNAAANQTLFGHYVFSNPLQANGDVITSGQFKGNGAGLSNVNSSLLVSPSLGIHNSFIGGAGNANISGNNNLAVGYSTLSSGTSAYDNTAIGVSALHSNVTSFGNTAIGLDSLYSMVDGTYNTAVGDNSAGFTANGNYNVAIGLQSLFNCVTGSQNTAIGTYALQGAVGSSFFSNTAVGYGALKSITSGSASSAFGTVALQSNTSGNENAAFGLSALQNNTIGGYNDGFGDYSLYSNTSGSYNASIGQSSGYSLVSGSHNTFIGYGADTTNSSVVNSTAIGNLATVTADNQMVFGNSSVTQTVLNGSVQAANIKATAPGSTIGTIGALPFGVLASPAIGVIKGSSELYITPSTGFWEISTYNWDTTATLPILMNVNGGNVGIGYISVPAAKLDVAGDIHASTTITATGGFVGNLTGNAATATTATNVVGGTVVASSISTTGAVAAATISATTFNVGTMTLTNPPVLNLQSSTNLPYSSLYIPTNSATMTVNMALPETTMQTNAAFVIAGYSTLNPTNYQHKMMHIYFTGFGQSSATAITFPANTHVQGTANYTNQTDVQFDYDPLIPITNALCLPRW